MVTEQRHHLRLDAGGLDKLKQWEKQERGEEVETGNVGVNDRHLEYSLECEWVI